jgi:5-methylcytosine-specific restriction enzyme subunit McrC
MKPKTRAAPEVIIVHDCSKFPPLKPEQEEWLRRLVAKTKPADMLLKLAKRLDDDSSDEEPIATFDGASGIWWAGRFVGEVHFEERTLRIEPRFGRPVFMRWLTTIWGVRFLESSGNLQRQRVWLWLIIAHLWAGQLIAAAKHGLPTRRVATRHVGHALRGRLLPRPTGLLRNTGDDRLMSETRVRKIDHAIGDILLGAFATLRSALAFLGEPWLSDRAQDLVDDLHQAVGVRPIFGRRIDKDSVRYSPITEAFRPVVELSLSILAQRAPGTEAAGNGKAFGILLDMAEIWELYVAKVLQVGLLELHVMHTGRLRENFNWLLGNRFDDDKVGSLRPDIMINDHQKRCVAIVDAKYKTTRLNSANRAGVVTEDLYQLAAYLSAFGRSDGRLDGFLVYPSDELGQIDGRLAPKNPWSLTANSNRNLWFVSTDWSGHSDVDSLMAAEQLLTKMVQAAIEAARP